MSDILCQWLNVELKISTYVEPNSFAKDFATGYLIGEVLHKYQLQDDFDRFSKSRAADSKLNNFSRMEPTLHLLDIPFDLNIAQAIMTEQFGVATRLLYQLYIALQRKKKARLTGVAMEAMRPAAPANLQTIESGIYKELLKKIVPREADLKLKQVSQRYELKRKEIEEKVNLAHYEELRKIQKMQQDLRLQDIEKHRLVKRRQGEIMARIQAAIVQIPKPPTNRTLEAIAAQKQQRKKQEAQEVYNEISHFEKMRKRLSPSGGSNAAQGILRTSFQSEGLSSKYVSPSPEEKTHVYNEYIQKIHRRLEEDAAAREHREKRRRRVLLEQLKAHEAQEEAYREEQLVNRLMRQSQQERRMAVQLMHARHEKDIIRQNRIMREKQYEERRLLEFQEALDREAALAKQEKIDYMEQTRKEIELHDAIAAEYAEARYRKHFDICQDVLNQIIDLVTKAGEYRELTHNLLPAKLMREWKELFYNGKPLYEKASVDPIPSEPNPEQLLELEKLQILDDQDYEEFQTMTGEWAPSEECEVKEPPANNNILGHVIRRLFDIINPPRPPTPPPEFPPFSLKACAMGKLFAGKSTCLAKIARAHHIQILSVDCLVQEAVKAFYDSEETEIITEEKETRKENQLTARAQLGAVLEKILKKGKSVPDEQLVDTIVEAISHLPAESGWVLDGFPVNLNQAKLLEKALSGIDPDKAISKKMKKRKTSVLTTDPTAPKEPPSPPPVLDLAVLFDVSDNMVLRRAAGSTRGQQSSDLCQEEFNPPPEGSITGVGSKEMVAAVKDLSHGQEQIQHRITGFLDTWPKLEDWFGGQQNILVKVNAEMEEDIVCKKVESILFEAMIQKEQKGKKLPIEEEKEETIPAPPAPAPAPTPPATPAHPAEKRPRSKSPKESQSLPGSAKDRKGRKPASPKGKEPSRKSSKSGASRSGSGRGRAGKKSEPTTPEVPSEPTPTEPPLPKPGSDQWVYVEETVPNEIAEYLVPYWENVCDTYINNTKAVMHNLRIEQDLIIHYLFNIRKEFKEYLKRPDHKQEFLSQWQHEYNCIADDMREDEETKAELHQRVDDLRERLWDICDNRREEAAQERNNIINDGWIEDHTGILINHYSSMMQVSVDRFQDTLCLLRDYYKGIEKNILPEASQEFTRIPLVDIINVDQNGDLEVPKSGSAQSERQTKSAAKKETEGEDKKQQIKKIPLVPRRPLSSDQSGTKIKNRTENLESKDEMLVRDIWQAALTAVSNMIAAEVQQRETEETEEQRRIEEVERQRSSQTSAAAGGKEKKKDQKSAKKKGASSPTPPPPPTPSEDDIEEEKKRELKAKMRQEYFGALEHEEYMVKARLELIKSKSLAVVRDLLRKAEEAYKEIEAWFGARFLAEMKSIDQITEIIRHHIETATKIQNELVLTSMDFYINGDLKVFPDPATPPRPPSVEFQVDSTLTILQLSALYEQFCRAAPKGLVSSKDFTDILQALTTLNLGNDLLPDIWMHLSATQIQELMALLTLDTELIDWHKFLLLAAQPWPYPSQRQLLQTLERFKGLDTDGSGFVTEEQFNKTDVWFTSDIQIPNDPTEPIPYDRMENLKKFFFLLFSDHQTSVKQLDYVNMLLYFAAHPDPVQGFYRALSITTGEYITGRKTSSNLLKSVPNMDEIPSDEPPGSETPPAADGGRVSLGALFKALCHGDFKTGDHNRFHSQDKTQAEYYENISQIYKELGYEDSEAIPYNILSQHPFMLDLIENNLRYKLTDIHKVLQIQQNEGVTQSSSAC
ncbi:sperm flagellar protein 2 isoform X1 [Acipenser oxyrinchus oxyrinchus]|uniref:Sperm flagellar protein 2 isoform X1 n=1 Tax=Acipenser oxyrinchus oxyrinchus TaxID=40147 RepID=A0AAD8LTT8_ACIOX|nr:sperm flagellar protein 2 isoform X1 [Acipenser oxyrinchus oxyrinchus]